MIEREKERERISIIYTREKKILHLMRTGKGDILAGDHPIQVAVFNLFEMLILTYIERREIQKSVQNSLQYAAHAIEHS